MKAACHNFASTEVVPSDSPEVIYSGQVVQPQRTEIVRPRRRRLLLEIRREHEGELGLHEQRPAERIAHAWSFGIVTHLMNSEQYTISKMSGNPRRVGRTLMASVRDRTISDEKTPAR